VIGCDGAAFSMEQNGSVFFIPDGFVTTGWRPPKIVRERLFAGDWAAWKATLEYLEDRLTEAQERLK